MTPSPILRVEVCIPRELHPPGQPYRVLEALLRTHGVLPPQARDLRWRMDTVNAGYLVSYNVPVSPEPPAETSP